MRLATSRASKQVSAQTAKSSAAESNMLVIDELKKNDPQLRLMAMVLAASFFILLTGLWWVQVVSVHEYQSHLETQSYRTIRIPAMRGKILDCKGRVLAENQASYNLNLYLDDLRTQFTATSDQLMKQAKTAQKQAIAAQEKKLGRSLTKAELKQFAIKSATLEQIRMQARTQVAANVVSQLSQNMGLAVPFDPVKFARHYKSQLAMPYTIQTDLDGEEIARFEESYSSKLGADLELQSSRYYPNGSLGAHLLGYLRKDNDATGEYNYRLPDFRGVAGVEADFNSLLRGTAGEESVLVNNLGYRQSQDIDSDPEPGHNVVLTVDLDIQRAVEASIKRYQPNANVAAVVMDVHNGDVLALASSPTFDPNDFVNGISSEKWAKIQAGDAEKNRVTYENYAPGSIFKTVVALAALENGLNPEEIYHVEADPQNPGRGYYNKDNIRKKDTAPPGDYNFKKAFIHSSNAYFINYGLKAGVQNIIHIGEEFHLGESTQLFPRQETKGSFPTLARVDKSDWRAGDTANMCIGQGEIAVTPMQMTVMVSAIANGGAVLSPRLVDRIEPQDPSSGEVATNYPAGLVRDHLTVHPQNLEILREAMLADVQSSEGSGRTAAVEGLQICGKTGTAQVQDSANRLIGHNYWFASFAPYEKPKYAVVVMVQSPEEVGSGGNICGPIAHDIYLEIQKKLNASPSKILAAAAN
jgi:penicillin-binding protein 2